MSGPLEKIYEDERIGQTEQRWSSCNIVEIGMACGTVVLNIIGRRRLYSSVGILLRLAGYRRRVNHPRHPIGG
jgi:uncharacterized membrane protein